MTLSPLSPKHLSAYIELYEQSFPPSERKDFAFMTDGPYANAYEFWVISTPEADVAGLVITVRHDRHVMLDYLAISPRLRGQGIGHTVLPKLKEIYPHDCLFLEIESPIETSPNLQERLRRQEFYTSCGLVFCGVKAYIYETDMELWAYPHDAHHVTFVDYQKLLEACFPPDMRAVEIPS